LAGGFRDDRIVLPPGPVEVIDDQYPLVMIPGGALAGEVRRPASPPIGRPGRVSRPRRQAVRGCRQTAEARRDPQ